MKNESFENLMVEVRSCKECKHHLPLGPRPIIQADSEAKILIIGQAPGRKVHESGIPWKDASGNRLREWLGLSSKEFYDEKLVALLPMGFCYPGTGDHGDLPPRKECFHLWHKKLIHFMPQIKLTFLLGSYAHASYLKNAKKITLTETVRAWREYLPDYIPLPHPSPLNNIWLHKNPWFEKEILFELKKRVKRAME